MAALNREYRGRRGAAEILTFPYGSAGGIAGEEEPIGEIFLCWSSLAGGARRRRVGAEAYLLRLVVHGLCHLMGHAHGDPASEERMEEVERALLARSLGPAEVERLFA